MLQVWEKKAAEAKEQYAKDLESYNANGRGGEEVGKKATKRGKKAKKAAPAVSIPIPIQMNTFSFTCLYDYVGPNMSYLLSEIKEEGGIRG